MSTVFTFVFWCLFQIHGLIAFESASSSTFCSHHRKYIHLQPRGSGSCTKEVIVGKNVVQITVDKQFIGAFKKLFLMICVYPDPSGEQTFFPRFQLIQSMHLIKFHQKQIAKPPMLETPGVVFDFCWRCQSYVNMMPTYLWFETFAEIPITLDYLEVSNIIIVDNLQLSFMNRTS